MDATTLSLDVHPDIANRIVAAADQLFDEGGRRVMPNVDSVRRLARVDMNAASKVMRAWRKALSGNALPVPNAIPDQISETGQALMQGLWKQASELANSSLVAAQTGWEAERTEAEGLRAQLAAAFDEQSNEMQALQNTLRDAQATIDQLQRQIEIHAHDHNRLTSQAETSAAEARHTHDRCAGLQDHIDDLRTALTRAQEQMALSRAEANRAAEAVASEIAQLNAEILHGAARLTASGEEAAALRGQVKLLQKQAQSKRSAIRSGVSPTTPAPGDMPPTPKANGRGNGGAAR